MRSRRTLVLTVLTLGVSLAFPSVAFGHGGVYAGPASELPPGLREPGDPPPPPCECVQVDCSSCTTDTVLRGEQLADRRVEETILRRVEDLEHVRFTVVFRGTGAAVNVEGHAPLAGGALMAVSGGSISHALAAGIGGTLVAERRATIDAKREYVRIREQQRDPLLVLPSGLGRIDVRAFPVQSDGDTIVVVEAWIVPVRVADAVRLYRTGDRYLCVAPANVAPSGRVVVDDAVGGRKLVFLDEGDARSLYPELVDGALEVPCVEQLEQAARLDTSETWVALEPDDMPEPEETDASETPAEPEAVPLSGGEEPTESDEPRG